MAKYRLLQVSNDSGTKEDVYFLDEDNTDDATDYCYPDQSVDFDGIIEADLPSAFPVESQLSRK